jgi:hypothetical protein
VLICLEGDKGWCKVYIPLSPFRTTNFKLTILRRHRELQLERQSERFFFRRLGFNSKPGSMSKVEIDS